MGWNERLEEWGHRNCQHPTTHTHSFSWEYAEPVRCVKPSSECKTAVGLGLGAEHEGWERWATTGVRDLSRCGKLSSGKQQLQCQFCLPVFHRKRLWTVPPRVIYWSARDFVGIYMKMLVYSLSRAAITKHHRLAGLNKRNWFSPSPAGWKFKN